MSSQRREAGSTRQASVWERVKQMCIRDSHFAAAGINVHVHLRSERARHDMLAHDRGVHKAEDTVGERQAAHEFGAFGEERGQGDEADAFTGEAQVLGEGALSIIHI